MIIVEVNIKILEVNYQFKFEFDNPPSKEEIEELILRTMEGIGGRPHDRR